MRSQKAGNPIGYKAYRAIIKEKEVDCLLVVLII